MGKILNSSYTVRKGARESQCQIDLNYGFTHSSSERGMKLVCVNFIQFQTFAKTTLKNRKYTFVKFIRKNSIYFFLMFTFPRFSSLIQHFITIFGWLLF